MMKWYVKDLSKLTNISVQTLHHYDNIDLLKPSLRLTNGYRLYSEKDLLKLQQIIALKFFGFKLSQIKKLLMGEVDAAQHFAAQARFLAEKAKNYAQGSMALQKIISDFKDDKSINWETIIKLIEVYRMTQELEKSWIGQVLTDSELKQYANFEAGLKTRFTTDDKKTFEQNWANLVDQIQANLSRDPKSDFGTKIAKQVMDLLGGLYGRENANLRHAIWHKGFKAGKADGSHYIAPEIVQWLDLAIQHYYVGRIADILKKSQTNSSEAISLWKELMEEMYGDSEELKTALYNAVMDDDKTSEAAKKWLQQFFRP